MGATVRAARHGVAFWGWKGQLVIVGTVLTVVGDEPEQRLVVDCDHVKRYSYNSLNGLFALRMLDGRKVYLHTSGDFSSADRSSAGHDATGANFRLLAASPARMFPRLRFPGLP